MTPQGLNELKGLATDVEELQKRASGLMMRIINLYQDEDDVEDLGAHEMLTKATVSLQKTAWRLGRAVKEIQGGYKAEKALMDFYDGLLNKLHNDDR